MNSKELEFGLRSLEADAALEAVQRRERGLPPHPDSPLTDHEAAELMALGGELDDAFVQGKADELLRALQQGERPAAPQPAPALTTLSQPERAEPAGGQVVAIGAARPAQRSGGRRLRYTLYAAAPLAAAAAVLLWLFPAEPLDTPIESAQLTVSSSRAAAPEAPGAEPAAPLRASREDCFNLKVALQKSARGLSEEVEAQAYLVSEGRSLRWNLSLQLGAGGVLSTAAGCQRLPKSVAGARAELVVLVGYPGRLLWHGAAAVREGTGAQGEYRGIQYVRRALLLGPGPGEPGN